MIDVHSARCRWLLGVLALIVGLICLGWRLQSPPQLGHDEEVFQTVDALFTALTSRDPQRLDDCVQRLQFQRETGRLPVRAARSLDRVIAQAQRGEWRSAAEQLYRFILGQRR
ncbi:MAG TPA: hypothetical protein VHB77_04115 [Planctomycetaceae bacterium]|nr:hypothetical protein [Planctomycetaceae bacterium]